MSMLSGLLEGTVEDVRYGFAGAAPDYWQRTFQPAELSGQTR